MVSSFKHKGLKEYFQKGKTGKIHPNHVKKIRLILFVLHSAHEVEDCSFPGSNLHKLKGEYEGYWAVKVSGNWRIIFRFHEGDVYDVDYLDYH